MGSSCSSGQAHKDKDNASQRSEESPSYQITCKNDPSASGSGVTPACVSGNPVKPPSSVPGPSAPAPISASAPTATKTPKPFRNVAPSSYSTDSVSPNSPPALLSPRDLDKTSLPPLLQKLPAADQHLLLGWPAAANVASKARKIVIYVCAADSQDCCIERGVLHNKIYPSLREKAAERGYELHIVDLHWKTALEKQQDHEFPELCLGELTRQSERGYVIPVVFLSHSLGTALLPKTIESQDFEVALSEAADKQLLAKWYQRDAHTQPPCYRLQPPHSHIPGFKDQCAEEKEKALAVWSSEIERILSVMLAAFPQELRDTYLTTVVEQEVHNTVLMSEELARRCLWLCRAVTHTVDNAKPTPTPLDVELNRRLEALQAALKAQLCEQHMMRLALRWRADETEQAQYAAEVMACLSKQLTSIIDAIVEEHQTKTEIKSVQGIESELLQELNVQSHFTRKAAQCSVNREAVLQQFKSYVTGETGSGQVVVVHGPAGCGKTTLLARTAQCCATWGPDCTVVARAANVSQLSRGLDQLLRTVCLQCELVSTGTQPWLHHNIKSYKEYLPSLLATASLQRTVVIILDGIDQVEESSYDWLPASLPPNVKVILSVTDSSPLLQQLKSHHGNGAIFIQIAELAKAEAESILLASVMEYSHSVNSHVHECVRASVHACTLPLYVKVVAWQTSLWCDAEDSFEPQSDVDRQLTAMLSQLEDRLGLEQVSLAMALLTSAKFGLTDSEMLDLLAFADIFHSNDTYVVWAPACLFWARLTAQLAPFLQWMPVASSVALQWRSHAVRAAVSCRYQSQLANAHCTLRDYYQGEMKQQKDERFAAHHVPQTIKYGKRYNGRKLEEFPYHAFHTTGSMWKLLEDDKWVFAKICGVSVYQVLEDIKLEEQSGNQRQDVKWLRDFLEKNSRPLAHDGRQLYSLLSTERSGVTALCTRWHALTPDPPVPSLILVTGVDSGEDGETSDKHQCLDMIIRLPINPNYVVTIATEKEEVSVWDVHSCCRVRTLEGITQPIDLRMIDDYRCVVLCKRELCTYDLNTGVQLTKLKGVMNQKMPYFGMHDANHLVALSRNRMYVNLMNLETGDLVTTFKAGEDRFLNSLLVSGDGRVLVCGDETQKPFPLLVWNLASRKLLYDLRIPHHDFITSLAAITYEGHYVCVVAKEVDEPSPNFIVVYDLQSGTLFKKWKPSVNTVSLDISSRDGCVLSGLEDGQILVWDLITGNCRWSLSGHSAPVTCLRLDPSGGGFLSFDAQCRDQSLRLWNLVTGELSAVLTPRAAITACELAAGGRGVLLAVQGRPALAALQLTPAEPPPQPLPPYGLPELAGRTFTLAAER